METFPLMPLLAHQKITMKHRDKAISFSFEKEFCLKNLQVWKNEASTLFYSAEVLHQFERLKSQHIFTKNEEFQTLFRPELTDTASFNYRTQRMLWAYGFENTLKLIILANYKKNNPAAPSVPFGEIKSHSLATLAKRASIELSEPEEFYCGILEKCSVWAGRYPLPLYQDQMYEQREPMPSREALIERSKDLHEKYAKGEIPRITTEGDILHSGMGNEEYEIYHSLKDRLLKQIEEFLRKENKSQQKGSVL